MSGQAANEPGKSERDEQIALSNAIRRALGRQPRAAGGLTEAIEELRREAESKGGVDRWILEDGILMLQPILSDVPDDRLIETLCGLLPITGEERDWQGRCVAARLLGKLGLGDERVGETLRSCLNRFSYNDHTSDLADEAVTALGELRDGDPRTLRTLANLLGAGFMPARATKALLMQAQTGADIVPFLLDASQDSIRRWHEPEGPLHFGSGVVFFCDLIAATSPPSAQLAQMLCDFLLGIDEVYERESVLDTSPQRAAETLGLLAHTRADDSPETAGARRDVRRLLDRALGQAPGRYSMGYLTLAREVAETGKVPER